MPLFAPENGNLYNMGLGAAIGLGIAKLSGQPLTWGGAIGAAVGHFMGMPSEPAVAAAPPPPPQQMPVDIGRLIALAATGSPSERSNAKRRLLALGIPA